MQSNMFSFASVAKISILISEFLILGFSVAAIFQKGKNALSLWGRWTFVTFLGFTVGILFPLLAMNILGSEVSAFAAGTVLGIAQWSVLRTRLDRAGYWILATSIGFMASVSITMYQSEIVEMLPGLFLGVIQLLILGPQYRGAAWWVFTSTIGIGYCVWITSTAGWPDLALFAITGASPIVYSALTGVAIVWLMQRSSPSVKGIAS